MGFLDKIFGKKEEEIAVDLTLYDLKKGYLIDYFLSTWKVIEAFDYDWGSSFRTKEFTLDNGSEKVFLHVEKNAGFKCTLSREISIHKIDKGLKASIIKTKKALDEVVFDNKIYRLEKTPTGKLKKIGESDWFAFKSWEYFDESEKFFISISRYDEDEIEAYYGEVVSEVEFSNILANKR